MWVGLIQSAEGLNRTKDWLPWVTGNSPTDCLWIGTETLALWGLEPFDPCCRYGLACLHNHIILIIYMYVCVCVCVCIHTYIYIYIYIYMCVYVYIYICMYVYIYLYIYIIYLPTYLCHLVVNNSYFWPCGLQDLSSPTRDWTCVPAVEALSPNHWTTREFPVDSSLY